MLQGLLHLAQQRAATASTARLWQDVDNMASTAAHLDKHHFGAFAFLSYVVLHEGLHQAGQQGVVEALPPLIQAFDAQPVVHCLEALPRQPQTSTADKQMQGDREVALLGSPATATTDVNS